MAAGNRAASRKSAESPIGKMQPALPARLSGFGPRADPALALSSGEVKKQKKIQIENLHSSNHRPAMSANRLPIPQYAMALAHVASLRSEDPYRKVGAAALDFDNFWDDRESRQKFMLHAEVNLCSLFRRGEAKIVATTTMPCTACMQTLCAYGIKEIYYREIYQISDAPEIAALYNVKLQQVSLFPGAFNSPEADLPAH
jgi:dCMP deaminase